MDDGKNVQSRAKGTLNDNMLALRLSSCGQSDGFEGAVHFVAERHVVPVEGGDILRWPSERAGDTGKQRLDHLVAQHEISHMARTPSGLVR